jgi:hypothetical protein
MFDLMFVLIFDSLFEFGFVLIIEAEYVKEPRRRRTRFRVEYLADAVPFWNLPKI